MKQLKSLLEEPHRPQLVDECVDVIEAEVKSKGGLSGIAVKTAFSVVMALKPGIIRESVDGLLDEFMEQVQPFYDQFQGNSELRGRGLADYLGGRADAVAESLLSVTDRRAERARNKTLVKAYNKLRPKGKEHVIAAIPRVGKMLEQQAGRLEAC